jgi:DNA-binding NtrC family response regulator
VKLRIAIIDDEQDILTLYKDFLMSRGHDVIYTSLNANDLISNFLKNRPNIVLLDYRLAGPKSGIDAAIEILTAYPLFPILFVTAYEQLGNDILKFPQIKDKNISILMKPVLLLEIENAILNLLSHVPYSKLD